AAAEELIGAVDREQVRTTVANVEQFTTRLNEASTDLDAIMRGVEESVAQIAQFSESANRTLARVDAVVDSVDPASVRTALTNFEQASTTVNAAVNDIGKVAQKVGNRAEDIDAIVTDARQLAARLSQASERIDGILVKVDGLLGSDEAGGLMTEASETLKAFREVADTLNARMGTIT